MIKTRTVEECMARACRLTRMADEASDYQTMLTYDALAREWLELASRQARAPVVAPTLAGSRGASASVAAAQKTPQWAAQWRWLSALWTAPARRIGQRWRSLVS